MPKRKIDIGNGRKHGQCSLCVQRDKLIIVFPRSCFGGKQKTLSLNLSNNSANRTIGISKLRAIQADIDLGKFDPTLERYKHQNKQQDYLSLVTLYPEMTLIELWSKYFEYKKTIFKESTIHYLRTSVEIYLEQSNLQSPYAALELREWLLNHTTQSMTKRVLTHINAAFK